MRSINTPFIHHKKLVIESKPTPQQAKLSLKKEQKRLKSRSSEFNIHKAISKGKNQNKINQKSRKQQRQSECTQNYLKLKLQNEVDPSQRRSRLSLQQDLFEPFKENLPLSIQIDSAACLSHLVQQVLSHMREHQELVVEEDLLMGRLNEVIVEIILWIMQSHLHRQPPRCNCQQLKLLLMKLSRQVQRQLKRKEDQSLRIDSGTVSRSWSGQQYGKEVAKEEDRLNHLTFKCSTLQQNITDLSVFEQSLKQQCKVAQQILQKHKRQCEQAEIRLNQYQQQLTNLNQTIHQTESRLAELRMEQSSIHTYSSQQHSRQLLNLISQDYRAIESDIYEYAVYLQSNQLASDINFEPHPFKQIEEQLDLEQKQVDAFITDMTHSVEEQTKMLKEFLREGMGKFKRKDRQMCGLLEFKTKCIKQFVDHMKKWLSNWQLKQEFLGNLRREFVGDAAYLRQALTKLSKKEISEEVIKIKSIFEKLIENYKMGNSFY